ncbi:uncharacterized protein LOC144709423 [Wolffia australiana]
MRSARLRRKWQSREERWRKVDREFDVVVVPSDGGGCLSGSESDDSDWSISWLEPHAPNFFADAEPPELDPESSFAIVVPCYAAPAATAPPTSLPTSSLMETSMWSRTSPLSGRADRDQGSNFLCKSMPACGANLVISVNICFLYKSPFSPQLDPLKKRKRKQYLILSTRKHDGGRASGRRKLGALSWLLCLRRCRDPHGRMASPQMEDMEHLFFHGESALAVWKWFLAKWDIPHRYNLSFTQLLESFLKTKTKESKAYCFKKISFVFMLWEIWKYRNKRKWEGMTVNDQTIIHAVTNMMRLTKYTITPTKITSPTNWRGLCNWNFTFGHTLYIYMTQIIRWVSPPSLKFKLNIDSTSKGNQGLSSGGVILRDQRGNLIFAFSNLYELGTNMVAECRSLLDGLELCEQFGFHDIWVESDSKAMCDMINSQKCNKWKLKNWWNKILTHMHQIKHISHIFREGNYVADALANHALVQKEQVFCREEDLPTMVCGKLRRDHLGMPYLKIRKHIQQAQGKT